MAWLAAKASGASVLPGASQSSFLFTLKLLLPASCPLPPQSAAYYEDMCVGCISCRLDDDGTSKKLYVMLLAVLAPYRGRGIGSAMLQNVLEAVEGNSKNADIKEIYLHVHTSNADARRLYERVGFTVTETVTGYYSAVGGVSPPDAHLLSKKVNQTEAPAA